MGSKKQTILTLNGQRYDALTGKTVDDAPLQAAIRPISDVVAPSRAAQTQLAPPTPAPTAAPKPIEPGNGPKVMDVSRSVGHTRPRQTQRASTLVRSAVSKPKPGLKRQLQVAAPAQQQNSITTSTVTPKWPISQVQPGRQNRATTVSKSDAISKFSNTPVDPAFEARRDAQVMVNPAQAVAAMEHQTDQSHDLFERAIAAAESHTQPPYDEKKLAQQAKRQAKDAAKVAKAGKRPLHHHWASVVAASVAVLIIGGFIGLQNKTALTLRFANAKAGFSASLPTYAPQGYDVRSFSYSAGNVGTTFKNSASGHTYSLSQQTTKWDSQALLNNYVSLNYPSYQALQAGNQIIYVYGSNNASWVKDGIWYQVTSNGNLSTSQVLSIASSI